MAKNLKPEFTGTLKEYIGSTDYNPITYHKSSLLQKHGFISYPIYNIFMDYMDEIKKITLRVRLNKEELDKYQFRPKLLAYDLYGSTELYFLLMIINNICDEKDFNFNVITIIDPEKMDTINDILIAEESYIEDNHYENA